MTINGGYAYVSTLHHPYIMGCFGPGNKVENLSQECSANPRECNMKEPPAWYEWSFGSDDDTQEIEDDSYNRFTISFSALIAFVCVSLFWDKISFFIVI